MGCCGALWKDVLREKYCARIDGLLEEDGGNWPRYASRLWNDTMTIDDGGGSIGSMTKL